MAPLRTILDHRSPVAIAALLSVCGMLLIGGIALFGPHGSGVAPHVTYAADASSATTPGPDWSSEMSILAATVGATTTDPISQIGPSALAILTGSYENMRADGSYTPQAEQALTDSVAKSLKAPVTFHTYTLADVKTSNDTTYDAMMQYRAELRDALAPLTTNDRPEFELFAAYVQSGDPSYLAELRAVADSYRSAASSTLALTVPKDAAADQVAILNAMSEFAATLDAMTAHASDPYASVALLATYNQAEGDMVSSFNDLATYFKSKLK